MNLRSYSTFLVYVTLVLALGSPPMRLAEAADDLARTVEEIGQGAGVEMIDGGVGDDAGESLRAVSHLELDLFGFSPLGPAEPASFGVVNLPFWLVTLEPGEPPPQVAMPPARRGAWLQRFRF